MADGTAAIERPTAAPSVRPLRAFEDTVARIRALILEDGMGPGAKLPAERALAARLGVNRHTLREALRTLEISGIIQLKRGAHGGAFLLDPEGDRHAGVLGRAMRFTDVSVTDLSAGAPTAVVGRLGVLAGMGAAS